MALVSVRAPRKVNWRPPNEWVLSAPIASRQVVEHKEGLDGHGGVPR
jgi:hypothetical protein